MTILSPGKQIFTYIGTSTYKYVKTIKKYEPLEVLCLFHLMTILIRIMELLIKKKNCYSFIHLVLDIGQQNCFQSQIRNSNILLSCYRCFVLTNKLYLIIFYTRDTTCAIGKADNLKPVPVRVAQSLVFCIVFFVDNQSGFI